MSADDDAADAAPDSAFARPAGVEGAFAPRVEPPVYSPPPPTVSPQERAVFERPPGADAFAPAPGERITPRPADHAPVPRIFSEAFGPTPGAHEGFDPEPGTRLDPSGPAPDSPWWKADARRDPWRDPQAAYWLGRGAIFSGDRPAQLPAAEDAEADELALLEAEEEAAAQPDNVRQVRFGRSLFATIAVVTLFAGLIGGSLGWWLTGHVHDALHRPDVSIAQVQTPVKRDPHSVAGVAKRVGPAVVSIAVNTSTEFAIGSGVVIDRDGDVLTNNHVVAAAAGGNGSIVVTFSNEATAKATIVGRDPTSDLAVLKVPDDELTVAQLGNSDNLAVGDPVIAIGSPLGLQGTVTEGIVSALNRPVHAGSEDGLSDAYLDAIQTDAAINPGNSGGALVNASGAVVGINTAGRFSAPDGTGGQIPVSGIGYAIPINYARQIALELIHTGKAVHATLGVQGVTALAGQQVGAYIKQVSPGGPADRAGLEPGDVVIAAGGRLVQAFDQLIIIVQEHKPGDRIPLTYYPKNTSKKVTTNVTLG
ncbi:MAG TPA: trypsin-like peptidase domain-containing protein [Jatrophihabitans sp.]|jgi:S1-C subfamily serine protease|nr:trypsin-like peptidase domain-containing protein [Jatrophihabitans sp.]